MLVRLGVYFQINPWGEFPCLAGERNFAVSLFTSLRWGGLPYSPCPSHYAGHLATMPSADFCLITVRVTTNRAIGLYLIRSPLAIHSTEPRHLLTRALLVVYRSPVKQIPECLITPDKNTNCPCATASFTVAVRSRGFVILC